MADMSPRQRLLASMRGEQTDRVAWSPFLAYFWESCSEEVISRGQLDFLNSIGADPLFRGSHGLYNVDRKNVACHELKKENLCEVITETPVGNLKETYTYSKSGNTTFLTEHPIKTEEDFKILTYIYDHMEITSNKDQFEKDYLALGDEGLYIPFLGTNCKTAFQSLLEHWCGTIELTYALADYPETIEECLDSMMRASLKTVELSVDSSAEAFISWEDTSTTNISPSIFTKYIAPEIKSWTDIIHSADKLYIHHACGHMKDIVKYEFLAGVDMVESLSPPPTGNIYTWEAFQVMPENIGIIGGIEPTVFLNSTLEELEVYTLKLLDAVKGRRFILANSDSCPPGVSLEKFKMVSSLLNR